MSGITDPIADMLTRIRNAQKAGHEHVEIPASKVKISIAHILHKEGFVTNFRCFRDRKQGVIKVALKFDGERRGAITEINRQSTPSKRVYVNTKEIPYVRNGFGVGIISTSRGVMTDRDARKLGIGGEYICSAF